MGVGGSVCCAPHDGSARVGGAQALSAPVSWSGSNSARRLLRAKAHRYPWYPVVVPEGVAEVVGNAEKWKGIGVIQGIL